MAHIPPDIVHLILAELPLPVKNLGWGENVTLSTWSVLRDLISCTLVCRMWGPIASSRLFHNIEYSFSYDLATLATPDTGASAGRWTQVPPDAQVPFKTLENFYWFLQDNSRIRRYIRKLSLCGFTLYHDNNPDAKRKVDAALLFSIINTLPHLEKLGLCNVATSPSSSPEQEYGAASLAIVRPLKCLGLSYLECPYSDQVNCCDAYTQLDVLQLLTGFGQVDMLWISPPRPSRPGEQPHVESPKHLRPRALFLRRSEEDLPPVQLLNRMVDHSVVAQSLTKLVLDDYIWLSDNAVSAVSFFKAVGPSLEELEALNCIGIDEFLNLSACVALRKLTVAADLSMSSAQEFQQGLDCLIPIFQDCGLSPNNNPALRELELRIELSALSFGEPYHDDPELTISDEDWATLRRSELDGALVRFVQKMGITDVRGYCQCAAWSDEVFDAPALLRCMLPRMAYKHLKCLEL